MADARPAQFGGKPAGWYKPVDGPAPGLSPVNLGQPKNPTRVEYRDCPECGSHIQVTDVTPEVTCECGEVVKL
jgi:hypothetical protein